MITKFNIYESLRDQMKPKSNEEIRDIMKTLPKWERGSFNTQNFTIDTRYGKETIQGCKMCGELVGLKNFNEESQMLGGVLESLCNCDQCGEYIIFETFKYDILEQYLKNKKSNDN